MEVEDTCPGSGLHVQAAAATATHGRAKDYFRFAVLPTIGINPPSLLPITPLLGQSSGLSPFGRDLWRTDRISFREILNRSVGSKVSSLFEIFGLHLTYYPRQPPVAWLVNQVE